MSEPTDRLQQLLSRVQQNRGLPRPASSTAPTTAAAAAKPAGVAAGMPPRSVSRAPIAEDRVSFPEHRAAARSAAPAEPAKRTPGRERLSTPLEMAVEDEIGRAPSEPPTTQLAASRPAQPQPLASAAPAPRPVAAPAKPQAAASRSGDSADFVIEAEPVREGARAIAQTVSKHAPELDATFGALLRRSLSLRPR